MNNSNIIDKKTHDTQDAGFARTREEVTTPPKTPSRSIRNIIGHSDKSEKIIERFLVDEIRRKKLVCLKYSNPNMVGYPDRVILLPGGKVIWVELKSKGRKPSKPQMIRMAELRGMGHDVRVIDSREGVVELIGEISGL